MNLTLRNDYGCTEAVIDENCGFDKFYGIAGLLAEELKLRFTNKIDDLNSSYWDFQYNGQRLTLHYNVYDGVSILPVRLRRAADKDNQAIKELALLLQQFK